MHDGRYMQGLFLIVLSLTPYKNSLVLCSLKCQYTSWPSPIWRRQRRFKPFPYRILLALHWRATRTRRSAAKNAPRKTSTTLSIIARTFRSISAFISDWNRKYASWPAMTAWRQPIALSKTTAPGQSYRLAAIRANSRPRQTWDQQ